MNDLKERLIGFRTEIQQELEDILKWWSSEMMDNEKGGFYGKMDGNGLLFPQANKGIILNSRIMWTFATAARINGFESYREIADRAKNYLIEYFLDKEHGGFFWMLDANGVPIQTKKQIYAQAFCIYAFSEYYLLTKDKAALIKAKEIFELIEQYSLDKIQGGYFEAFSQNWELLDDLRLSDKDANEAKTMNTHLHILEAYTNLYRAEKTEEVGQALKTLIECFLDKFINLHTYHLNLFFDENWKLKSDEISFGHDIECSWLLVEAAEVLGEKPLIKKVVSVALKMAEVTQKEGLDDKGGLFYERKGKHLDTDKHWWPQAEAIVGFLDAWHWSKDPSFLEVGFKIWVFIKDHLKDKQKGEWHWRVNGKGDPILSEEKAGPWKAPYHNGRMCMEILSRISEI